ncbi:L-alanine-DL-glutamate epimerase-like enolase superfamily enzyme [Povalibacter uvarum]|uniref:Dipeptide epimerase n=1 Tax=Povalibacter uvarum TaxID=732238 RepID=A0A841HMC5_9GAMM|nr:dipeptide epimerase [Povalibacter uvarum]MBB6093754.1 L-alanine-DL-glutamate epimerase-like enolase superfamily enzyme [Povalibacter uvarum]
MSASPPIELQVDIERLTLKAPFRISGYTFTEVPVAVVTLRRGDKVGRGEAAGVYYLEDTPDRIVQTIEAQRSRIERGIDREQLLRLLPAGGARNAVDCALWDLEAREAGRPVWELAGLDHIAPRITTFTLSADDPPAVAQAAMALGQVRAIKMKLNGDLATDIERVRAVREARADVWLGVDANQGHTRQSLDKLLPVLVDARVQLLEQPLPRGQEAQLEGFDSPIPVAADESVQGLTDVAGLVGRFDVVNIKLDKCGGLTEALQIVNEARSAGLQVMVGNMVGTSLAMAPAFVVAQLCDYVDLDGPTFLAQDCRPSVRYDSGSIHCSENVWGGGRA